MSYTERARALRPYSPSVYPTGWKENNRIKFNK